MSNEPLYLLSTVAFVFLDETLHTKKKGGSHREQEGVSDQSDSSHVSCNSGIEMMKQDAYGEEVERDDSDAEMQHLTGTSKLIAEGDLDSQSDDEVSSGDGCIPFVMWCTHCKEEFTPRNTRSFVVGKLKSGVAKLKMLLALMCDRRVLFSVVLCGLVSCIAVTSNEVSMYTSSDTLWYMQ